MYDGLHFKFSVQGTIIQYQTNYLFENLSIYVIIFIKMAKN